ncbi:MAG: hypothetical protein Ta2D_03540 [Rickettsiales bacterium]|nr:MAG: hypothetical protein Ta2D_03540 [Rickettsiales bacterium]
MFGFFAKIKEVCEVVIGYKLRFDTIENDLNNYKVRFDTLGNDIKELRMEVEKNNNLASEVILIKTNHLPHLSADIENVKKQVERQTEIMIATKSKLELLIELLNKQNKIL